LLKPTRVIESTVLGPPNPDVRRLIAALSLVVLHEHTQSLSLPYLDPALVGWLLKPRLYRRGRVLRCCHRGRRESGASNGRASILLDSWRASGAMHRWWGELCLWNRSCGSVRHHRNESQSSWVCHPIGIQERVPCHYSKSANRHSLVASLMAYGRQSPVHGYKFFGP
jgi:hypothetical protein